MRGFVSSVVIVFLTGLIFYSYFLFETGDLDIKKLDDETDLYPLIKSFLQTSRAEISQSLPVQVNGNSMYLVKDGEVDGLAVGMIVIGYNLAEFNEKHISYDELKNVYVKMPDLELQQIDFSSEAVALSNGRTMNMLQPENELKEYLKSIFLIDQLIPQYKALFEYTLQQKLGLLGYKVHFYQDGTLDKPLKMN